MEFDEYLAGLFILAIFIYMFGFFLTSEGITVIMLTERFYRKYLYFV